MPSDAKPEILWPRVIGQERVKRLLLNAMRLDRLPHALLFHGPEGVGKDALALELARVIHCERGGDEACGECGSCLLIASLQHPDVRVIVALPLGKDEDSHHLPLEKIAKADLEAIAGQLRLKGANPYHRISIPRANVIKINSVREPRRETSYTSATGKRRVFIVMRAEELGDDAAHTILKTLEEPPGHSLLILTSSYPDALLPTIVSRCQQVRFDPLSEGQIAAALQERAGAAPGDAALAARLAGGSYTRALALLDEGVAGDRREITAFVRLILGASVAPLAAEIERRAGLRDREATALFLRTLLLWFRDAMVLSRGGSVINIDQREDLERFVSRFPSARLPEVVAEIERALFLLDRNVYIQLILTNCALRLKQLILP